MIEAHVVKYGGKDSAALVGIYKFRLLPRIGEFISLPTDVGERLTLKVASVQHDGVNRGEEIADLNVMLLCEDETNA